jgi:hypothetical protein
MKNSVPLLCYPHIRCSVEKCDYQLSYWVVQCFPSLQKVLLDSVITDSKNVITSGVFLFALTARKLLVKFSGFFYSHILLSALRPCTWQPLSH